MKTDKTLIEKEIIKNPDYIQRSQKVVLKEKGRGQFIKMDTITHLICDCYLTTVYTTTGTNYVIAKLLKDFELELSAYGFVRINRNTIINSSYVQSYRSAGNRSVTLSNGEILQASRRGLVKLKEEIGC